MPAKISNFARPVQNRKYAGSTTPKYAAKERFRSLEECFSCQSLIGLFTCFTVSHSPFRSFCLFGRHHNSLPPFFTSVFLKKKSFS
jgi:hypothetical protein